MEDREEGGRPSVQHGGKSTQGRLRAVVLGAGVIGTSIAWRLATRGCAVTVVEANAPGSGTSSTSFAWVNASSKHDYKPAYFDLNHAALREHHALRERLGMPHWFFPVGDIELALSENEAAALQAKIAYLQGRGYRAERIARDEARRLEPGIRAERAVAAAHYPEEGWVHVPGMVAGLAQLARAAGATFVTNTEAGGIVTRGGAATGVRLTSGEVVAADVVVSALGVRTTEFARRAGANIPLVATEEPGSRALGLLVTVAPAGDGPRRLAHCAEVNWSPRPDGRALLASDAADRAVAADRSPASMQGAADMLVARAAAFNDVFRDATIEQVQLGLRALPIDGETICGRAGSVDGFYVVATHSGVTLAPLLSDLVAREVAEGREEALLAAFRPARFAALAT